MLGAIAGDIIGSVYECERIKTTDFPLFAAKSDFTDDTVLTVATAHSILTGADYAQSYKDFSRRHPNRGYGGTFALWTKAEESHPYNSYGNGSAMRVGPVGFAFDTIDDVLANARRSAEVTHNHPEGIKGAQATALAVRLAVSLGADSGTLACITGSIAEAFYKHIPEKIQKEVRDRLPGEFLEIIDRFNSTYRAE
jgi:ADP-ribosylglycohydrolase